MQWLFPNFATPRKIYVIGCTHGRNSCSQMFYDIGVLENFKKFREKNCPVASFLDKIVQKSSAQVFCNFLMEIKISSSKICEILKITYFGQHLQTAVSICRRLGCNFAKKETQSQDYLQSFFSLRVCSKSSIPKLNLFAIKGKFEKVLEN